MKSIQQFLHGVRVELSKVVWPKYDELVGSIVIVLILVFAFSVYLGAIDFCFYRLAEKIFVA